MKEAVDAPRFHHQWLPDKIWFEPQAFHKLLLENEGKQLACTGAKFQDYWKGGRNSKAT